MSSKKKRKRMHARVSKVMPSMHGDGKESAQIDIHEADPLYREVRVENELTDEDGKKTRLKPGEEVEVVIEAREDATAASSPDGRDRSASRVRKHAP